MAYCSYFSAMMEIARVEMVALLPAGYNTVIDVIKARLIAEAIALIKVLYHCNTYASIRMV